MDPSSLDDPTAEEEELNDLCISRPKDRLEWGIELPFDEGYVTYVWFDALVNYISAIGYGTDRFDECWPVDYHVIGKDILVPAHAIYWPIMLKACDIPLPKGYLVHGWWMIKGSKMSKSQGETMSPLELAEKYGTDTFRYFVTREMTVGQDSDFSNELFNARYTAELGNDLGNLVSRFLNMTARYADGRIPAETVDEEPEQNVRQAWAATRHHEQRDNGDAEHKGNLGPGAIPMAWAVVQALPPPRTPRRHDTEEPA